VLTRITQFYLPSTCASTDRMSLTCLYSQPQSITALLLVLISRPTEGRRLSWPGWLVTHEVVCLSEDGHPFPVLARPDVHRVSKNVPPLTCYNFDTHEWILIFFGRNVTDKVGNQKTLYYATPNNLCFCSTCQNGETRKSHFSLNWIVLHTQCTCVLSS